MPAKTKAVTRRELKLAPAETSALQARLRRLEGQVRAIHRMIDERADCHDIVQQMSAARGALERAMVQLMVSSITQCVRAEDGGIDEVEMRRLGESFAKLL